MALSREAPMFLVVGAAATATHVSVALGAQALGNVGALTANLAGYLAAVGVSYLGNALATFRRPAANAGQFGRFMTISLAAFLLNQAVVFAAVRILHWPLWAALIPAVAVVTAASFVLTKLWAFGRPFGS